MTTNILLHIPHDSTHISSDYRDLIILDDQDLEKEIIAMTDMHTAQLYQAEKHNSVIFPVSRLVVDPERFSDDTQEIMAQRGMGVIYTVTSQLQPLKNNISPLIRQKLLDEYYFPHHQKLTDAVAKSLEDNGHCLIIDCHSFPSRPMPYELKNDTNLRCEICIGTDAFHTPKIVSDTLYKFFKDKGYSVSIDDPFAGALVPMDYYQKNKSVMSVMYEIRRDLYMDENTGVINENFKVVQNDIAQSLEILKKLF